LEIGGYHGLVGLATILFGHKKKMFWALANVFDDWWLSWPCGVGPNMVWAQKKVFLAHIKVFGEWWLSRACGIGRA